MGDGRACVLALVGCGLECDGAIYRADADRVLVDSAVAEV